MQKGSLKVVTTGMRAGYFRKNGLPYSENATLTEYFDRHDDFGAECRATVKVTVPRHRARPAVESPESYDSFAR